MFYHALNPSGQEEVFCYWLAHLNQNKNILKYQASIKNKISESENTDCCEMVVFTSAPSHYDSQMWEKVHARSKGLLVGTLIHYSKKMGRQCCQTGS